MKINSNENGLNQPELVFLLFFNFRVLDTSNKMQGHKYQNP
jgi:hypothetical protein